MPFQPPDLEPDTHSVHSQATCVQNRHTTNKNKAHILRTHHKTIKYERSKQYVSSKSFSPVEMVSNENYPVEPHDTDRGWQPRLWYPAEPSTIV